MVVPTFNVPGYGAQYAALEAAGQKANSDAVASQLSNYADVIRGIMSNAKDIASVSGTPALDMLLNQYGGGPGGQTIFGSGYGGEMDKLRMAAMRADIAAAGRRGTGGGGAEKPSKGILYEITYPDGRREHRTIGIADIDQLGYLGPGVKANPIVGGGGGTVIGGGDTVTAPAPAATGVAADQTSAVTGAPPPAPDAIDRAIERARAQGIKVVRDGDRVLVTDPDTGEITDYANP